MRHAFSLLATLFLASAAFGQNISFSPNLSIPVSRNGQPLNLPWAGGLHAPQFSRIDLNNDGIRDLVVFDRGDGSVLPFINSGQAGEESYNYAPVYARLFPTNLTYWMLLADFNCDGLDDIFTSNPQQGITVYRNTSQGGNLQFTLEQALLSTSTGFQIEVPATDIPAILDVDDDGDLDVLAFDFAGSYVVHYQNNQSCGVQDFSIGSLCWGQFSENAFNSNINLGVSCRYQLPETNTTQLKDILHAGSTLLLLDTNADGQKEALIGDISSSQMVFLQNSASGAMVSQTTNFPASQPVDLFIFPASYQQDVDNDGLSDLLIAPNNGADPGGKNYEQVWFYKNTGTNNAPVFSYQKNDFLVEQMLDFGSGTAPAFFDFDADGDLDLVVGNYGYRQDPNTVNAKLALLENTGTASAPAYNLINDDYLSVSSLPISFITDLAPAFGDLDGDGDLDLLIGKNDGNLIYFQNTAGAGQPASFSFVTATYQNINVGLLSKPQIIDLNRDNLPDLVIGERNGNINYYRNTGTVTNAVFTLETDALGEIDLFAANFGAANAAPFIADLDSNGMYDLLVGDRLGRVHVYPNIEANLTGTFSEINNTFYEPTLTQLDNLRHGQRAVPAATDLNGDGKPDLVIGTLRGGLGVYYNMTGLVSAPEALGLPKLHIWPNPAQNHLYYSVPDANATDIFVRAFTMLGQELQLPKNTASGGNGAIDISAWPAGMYVLQFSTGDGRTEVRKIVKE